MGADGKSYKTLLHIGKTTISAASPDVNEQLINYYLEATDITGKNTLISAIDGNGKTHTASIIIEEIANKTRSSIVIIDPNNEYAPLGDSVKKEQNYSLNFQSIPVNIESSRSAQEKLLEKIKQSKVTALTAEHLTLKEKNETYSNILDALAQLRRQKAAHPFLLVVEDAENVSPEAIREIISVKSSATILITCNPGLLSGKILTHLQTQIVGKTIDPDDLKYLENMIGCANEQLLCLRVGEWVISGLNLIRPTKIHVKPH